MRDEHQQQGQNLRFDRDAHIMPPEFERLLIELEAIKSEGHGPTIADPAQSPRNLQAICKLWYFSRHREGHAGPVPGATPKRRSAMPLVNIEVIKGVFTAHQKRDLIARVTDAMV